MEELKIKISELEGEAQSLLIDVDRLNDYGNTPDQNYQNMLEKLLQWKVVTYALQEMKELKSTIESNAKIQP